jgi:hypothetical protein
VDFNGMQSYSEIVAVTLTGADVSTTEFSFSIYPNPGNGQDIHLAMNVVKGQELAVSVIDAFGKECFYELVTAAEDGAIAYTLPQLKLTPGIYFISVMAQKERYNQKLIVE